MDTTTTIYFVGGHSVSTELSADEIIGKASGVDGGLYEPATVTLPLGDGRELCFNPVHIACIETVPKENRSGAFS